MVNLAGKPMTQQPTLKHGRHVVNLGDVVQLSQLVASHAATRIQVLRHRCADLPLSIRRFLNACPHASLIHGRRLLEGGIFGQLPQFLGKWRYVGKAAPIDLAQESPSTHLLGLVGNPRR